MSHSFSDEELQALSSLSASAKVQLLEILGFTRFRNSHEASCCTLQGSGYICTCVAPASAWEAPGEVSRFLGETFEERKEFSRRRLAAEDGQSPSWRI
jgi:hypothetical protein